MKKRVWLATAFPLIVSGCSHEHCDLAHESCPNLKQMARALEQFPEEYRSTFATDQLQMTIASRLTSGHLVFHCRLKNEDWRPVALDRSALPWTQPWLFNGTFVTATGYTSSIMNNIIANLVAWPEPFLLAPNEVIEGDIQLDELPHQTMRTNPLPYGRESLLLWSYHLGTYGETLPPTPGRDDPPPDPSRNGQVSWGYFHFKGSHE